MKLPEKEENARRAAFRNMNAAEKLDYILSYYKLPIVLILIAAIVFGSALHRRLTKKDPVLYLGFVNVAVGDDLRGSLTDGFLQKTGANPRKQEVTLYEGLYLSRDADTVNHQYAYGSRMKVLGSIEAEQLDAVLMNREAYDIFSESGYLLNLGEDPAFSDAGPLVTNKVILSDNSIEYQLGEADSLEIKTKDEQNALLVNEFPAFAAAGFPENVYFGVIANTQRKEAVSAYLAYLSEEE